MRPIPTLIYAQPVEPAAEPEPEPASPIRLHACATTCQSGKRTCISSSSTFAVENTDRGLADRISEPARQRTDSQTSPAHVRQACEASNIRGHLQWSTEAGGPIHFFRGHHPPTLPTHAIGDFAVVVSRACW